MLLKKQVLKSISEMPEEFSVDDAIDRLILLNKIEKGRNEIKLGKGLSTTEARKILSKWLN